MWFLKSCIVISNYSGLIMLSSRSQRNALKFLSLLDFLLLIRGCVALGCGVAADDRVEINFQESAIESPKLRLPDEMDGGVAERW